MSMQERRVLAGCDGGLRLRGRAWGLGVRP